MAYNVVNGHYEVASFWGLLLNPWGLLQYLHNMTGAVMTGSFVMAAVGAFYLLEGQRRLRAHLPETSVIAGIVACIAIIFPTGDLHGKYVARHQPVAMAAMEGLFQDGEGRAHRVDRQPMRRRARSTIQSRSTTCLSFLIYGTTKAEV